FLPTTMPRSKQWLFDYRSRGMPMYLQCAESKTRSLGAKFFAPAAVWFAIFGCVVAADDSVPPGAVPNNSAPTAGEQKPDDDPSAAEVKQLAQRYFSSWSSQDMDAYGDCFLPGATIQYVDAQGNLDTQQLRDFLAAQKRFQLMRPAKESP